MTLQAIKKRLLDLAIHGSLVPQIESEGTADDLLQLIADEHKANFEAQQAAEKEKALKDGKNFKPKEYSPLVFSVISESEKPFDIPNSWKWVRLKDIGDIVTGTTPSKSHPEYYGTDYPFFKPGDLDQGMEIGNSVDGLSKEGILQTRFIRKNSVLVTCIGATIGKSSIILKDGACNQQINAIMPFLINAHFLYYVMISSDIQTIIRMNASATTLPILNKQKFSLIPFPLPPLSEQTRIVTKLETMLTEIDGIEQSQKEIDGLKTAIWRRCLSEAISGRLTTQQPSDGSADDLLEQIKAAHREAFATTQKKYKPLTFSPIPDSEIPFEIPENWRWVRLGEIGEYRKGPFGSSLTKSMFVPKSETTIKVYEQKNAIQKDFTLGSYYITNEKYESMQSFIVRPNDIIVSCAGTIGECYQLPHNAPLGIINQALMRVRLYMNELVPFWMLYFDYYLKKIASEQGSGTAIKNIPPFEILKAYPFPLPPLSEQLRIVSKLEKLRSALDKRG